MFEEIYTKVTSEIIESYNSLYKGKYIICRTKESSKTRHFICRLSPASDVTRKEGWWDTFTISKEEAPVGINLFEVDRFSKDKNDHLILIVKFIKGLSQDNLNLYSKGWQPLLNTGKFCKEYTYNTGYGHMNRQALISLIKEKNTSLKEDEETLEGCFRLFMEDKLSIKEIEAALNTLFPDEIFFKNFAYSLASGGRKYPEYKEKWPLLFSKVPSDGDYYLVSTVKDYISKLLYTAENRKGTTEVSFLDIDYEKACDEAEWLLQVYQDEKQKQKEASKEDKKAARKARREAEKAVKAAKHEKALAGRKTKQDQNKKK